MVLQKGETTMKYRKLTDINQAMTASEDAMRQADLAFLDELEKVADAIRKTAVERPVILLAGPSGSGKTTTAFLLERFLDGWGVETHTISMDNFFSTMTSQQREMAATGKLDLESPARVDIPYLQSIIACKPTWMPRYHFPTTTRIDQDWQLTRKPGELLLLEGIHALNPDVITIPEEMTVRLYVSVRTRVTNGETVLHPSRLRLMRRMLRDKNFRQRSVAETLSMFEHVQAGEHKYIAPYKKRADFSIDTFLPYELGIYKTLLDGELEAEMQHPMLLELRQMWDDVAPLTLEHVPADSLVREFAGDSVFQY